jgi:hypothetical protein
MGFANASRQARFALVRIEHVPPRPPRTQAPLREHLQQL